jgi:hypothetical protein
MTVKVKEQLKADREAARGPLPLPRQSIPLRDSPLGQPLTPAAPSAAAKPGHRRQGAVDMGKSPISSAAAQGHGAAANRSAAQQNYRLQAKLGGVGDVGDPENLKKIIEACHAITLAKTFAKYVDDEVGWANWTSWMNWMFRAAAPAMMQRPVTEEIMESLRRMSLDEEINKDRKFAGRFFFELSLYCEAQIESMDIEFTFSQAALLFGVLLGPLLAVPGKLAGAAGGKAAQISTDLGVKAARFGIEMGAKAGLKAGLGTPQAKKYKNLNAMRYALALWKFITTEKQPADAIKIVLDEFGGKRRVERLREWLELNNQ